MIGNLISSPTFYSLAVVIAPTVLGYKVTSSYLTKNPNSKTTCSLTGIALLVLVDRLSGGKKHSEVAKNATLITSTPNEVAMIVSGCFALGVLIATIVALYKSRQPQVRPPQPAMPLAALPFATIGEDRKIQ